jgi:CheY-like chemotaxis protein
MSLSQQKILTMKTHIFLIDDDINEMKIFVDALKEVTGAFKCTYASNGIHALKMLLYLKPEAIFVDYNMPVMNGLELTREF